MSAASASTVAPVLCDQLIHEDLLAVAVVVRNHPATKSVTPRTASRWALRGVNGIKLPSLRIGGRLMTSTAALERFLIAINQGPAPAPSAPRSPAERRRASEQAAKQLEAVGA